jgi:hypothetical protein
MVRLMHLDRRLTFRFLIVLDRPETQFGEARI